jgi:hypothetical protein
VALRRREGAMERKNEKRLVCDKRRCRNAFRAHDNMGRYHPSQSVIIAPENPIKPGTKSDDIGDRPWRVVACQITPPVLHCATIGGSEAVEAINRTNARHWREYNTDAIAEVSYPL